MHCDMIMKNNPSPWPVLENLYVLPLVAAGCSYSLSMHCVSSRVAKTISSQTKLAICLGLSLPRIIAESVITGLVRQWRRSGRFREDRGTWVAEQRKKCDQGAGL